MKTFKLLLICTLIYSCGGPRAVYDYDEQANFNSYSSIALYPETRTGLSELDEKRLLSSVENFLASQNLAATGEPDLYLNVYTEQYQEPSRTNVGVGIGGTGRNVGVGVSGGIPLGGPETFLRLTFDLIDGENDALVWQAIVDSKFDFDWRPEEREQHFAKIVEEAMAGYPPKK
ncbi:DUF4136 domain-containing protein [Salinimicrobium sp. TH3]|uniref:DUF4136 domain-containing protein n=1 Tax=Salinimicrobium sp. TH3 TaxID=2997342 RepID=UPI002273ECAC|nr:DUF4136 domain-containing protein [Salinimicrobium sp. TH3]MCY2688312.1 DUF4136 domain-containing protein [Salinimicrobium sp. TH3]